MNDYMLQRVREVLAEQRKAILESENPKAVATTYLQQTGYLDKNGEVAETYKGGLIESVLVPSTKMSKDDLINFIYKRGYTIYKGKKIKRAGVKQKLHFTNA